METFAAVVCLVLLSACATQEPVVPATAFLVGWIGMAGNAMLPQKSAGNLKSNPNCVGDNVSPPVRWSNAPQGGRFIAGKSTPGLTGWFGPCPPRGNAPQHYVLTLIATSLEPTELAPGLTKTEVLKALAGGKALRAASYVFRYAH